MADYQKLWDSALVDIRQELASNGKENEFFDWFQSIVFEKYEKEGNRILLQVPSDYHRERIEHNYLSYLAHALFPRFGSSVRLRYRVLVDAQNNKTVLEEGDAEIVKGRGTTREPKLAPIDPQLDIHLNFDNFIEGESNKLSRSVGMSIAEHPRSTKFNPMFVFGASGVGKTHLINAIGVRAKELYKNLRVLYVSARTFQQQYTTAVLQNSVNDFIAFYQTIDVLIVDDIQEWMGVEATQNTFFHIFDYLFRHGKRIILASDRSPSQLRGMHERLITRFSCGVTTELEKPNTKLCMDILKSKINRDGLSATIPENVIRYIAETVNGSVRDLQGVINSLMVYSIVDNTEIDIKLAEKIVRRVVCINDEPMNIDTIMDAVCEHINATQQDINGKSRKKEFAIARHIVMYLAKKHTNMSDARIGRLVGGRDHSTVIHSCKKIETDLQKDKNLKNLIIQIEKEMKKKKN